MADGDVAHCDRALDSRSESSRRNGSDSKALGALNFNTLARRSAAVGFDSHQFARRTFGNFPQDAVRSRKTAAVAPTFLNGPEQRSLDGRRVIVDIVAVETEAGFQPQTVACAKSGGCTILMRQECPGNFDRAIRRDGDLITVLAGVAEARNPALRAEDRVNGRFHEFEIAGCRTKCSDHILRLWSLHGHQRAVGKLDHVDTVEIGAHMADVLIPHRCVDHREQIITGVGHDQIVHDPAIGIGEERVTGLAFGQWCDACRHQGLELFGGTIAAQLDLTHVGNVEKRRFFTTLGMFAHDPHRILDGHFPAGEVNHLAAEFDVQIIKWRAARWRLRWL